MLQWCASSSSPRRRLLDGPRRCAVLRCTDVVGEGAEGLGVEKEEEEEELEAVLASKEQRLIVEAKSFARSWDGTSRLSPVGAVAVSWCEAKDCFDEEGKETEEEEE